MSKIDISIVVKTFLRPQCIRYFLESVVKYQDIYGIEFSRIIVIDDSNECYQKQNDAVISCFSDKLSILYQAYPYNSLGLSKGRNIGVSLVETPYLILCDDDYIFDPGCDLKECLRLLVDMNIDLLGGFYKNISKHDDKQYTLANWLGFYHGGEMPTLQIYTDFFPDLKKCTVVQNFFLAKTVLLKQTKWDEALKVNEHNEFFCRLEQNGAKIYFTNKLFIKHLHIDNKEKTYANHRVLLNKPTINSCISVFVSTRDCILRSTDITLHTINTFRFVENRRGVSYKRGTISVSFSGVHITIDIAFFPFTKKVIKNILKCLSSMKNSFFDTIKNRRLRKIQKLYPEVISTTTTIAEIVQSGKSLARFGDGELQLILGIGLGSNEHDNEYQIADVKLQKRLAEILASGSNDRLAVAISPFCLKHDWVKQSTSSLGYWENFLFKFFSAYAHLLTKHQYYNALISRSEVFYENTLDSIKKLWDGKKVLFVIGENSHFFFEKELFDNIVEYKILYGPGKSAFSKYDELLGKICEYDKNWLIFLSLGPTATVLAYDLAQRGYQALDLGHLPNCYRQWQGKLGSPEEEDGFHKLLSKKQAIY